MTVRWSRQLGMKERVRRLTDERGLRLGNFAMRVDLDSLAHKDQLLGNLSGTCRFESRDGKVMKFALLEESLAAARGLKTVRGRFRS